MRIVIATLLITLSSLALPQEAFYEVKWTALSDHASFGAWERSKEKAQLDTSLSKSLMSKVVRSSEPYAITNMPEIQQLIDSEKSKLYPDLKMSLNTFKGSEALKISIDRIHTRQGRDILRGRVEGYTDSHVKLVVYKGQMTGRITLSNKPRVIVIRSVNGGITANYEVDTSDVSYD